MTKEGYQPIKNTTKIIPPKTGSCVRMKKDGYTWEDLDRSYWEGFDNAKNKMEKRIEELEKENKIIAKALDLYINWADECGVAWDNFPDMTEKWYKTVEEKGLGWIEGLTFMVTEEAKEQLRK